jgi:ethanolamine utilization protein EutQ (cupin superfamily)
MCDLLWPLIRIFIINKVFCKQKEKQMAHVVELERKGKKTCSKKKKNYKPVKHHSNLKVYSAQNSNQGIAKAANTNNMSNKNLVTEQENPNS